MKAAVLRKKFIDFFISKDHKQIPPASLVPENDPTTLFTSSGMQPLVPYLKGETHPMGKRLVNSQPCFRAEDIGEVGDNRHTTFFEMLGNWSLGDYFKKEQLSWFFNFLTKIVGLDPTRLYVTVFKDENKIVPYDSESELIWKEQFGQQKNNFLKKGIKKVTVNFNPKKGIKKTDRIFYYGVEKNWWSRSGQPQKMPLGEIGGPDSEVFYDFGPELKIHQHSSFARQPCHPNCDCGRFLEIGNSVFIEYQKNKKGLFEPLANQNVDFGGGLERILAAKLNNPDIFQTDLFWPIIKEIIKLTGKKYQGNERAMRIIADHLKAAIFMIKEKIEPSNKLQGYVLRRLLRRAALQMKLLGGDLITSSFLIGVKVLAIYQDIYFDDLSFLKKQLKEIIPAEVNKFNQSLKKGIKRIEKIDPFKINGQFAFDLFQTYGLPFEITREILLKKGITLNKKQFLAAQQKHQRLSQMTAKGIFKSGLAGQHSKKIINLHTATHLLHQALRCVLSDQVKQVGSNITNKRLRFDFTYPKKLNLEQLKKIEKLVNQKIKENLKVKSKIMSLTKAKEKGALAFFGQKYPSKVKVYSIGNFSQEVCTGPHVCFTGKLGRFMIKKEESCGAGKRRIYAVLKNGN